MSARSGKYANTQGWVNRGGLSHLRFLTPRKCAAFTLVELLVVIAIIALLMSILMPSLAGARKQAQGVVCQSNLHSWGLAFQLFAHDNSGYFPKSVPASGYWLRAMLPYVGVIEDEDSKARDIFLCPSARKSKNQYPATRSLGTTFSPWGPFGPGGSGAWWDDGAMGSYGINEWCANPDEDEGGLYWGFPAKYAWRSPDVKGGAGIVPVLLDCLYVDGFPLHVDPPPLYPEVVHDSADWAQNAMQLFCIDRHKGGINGLFIDYSVRKVGLKELWRLKWSRGFKTNEPAPIWKTEAPWMVKYRDY